ncbi:MAG: DUF2953 domain-containing protein [Firmicutes bacterium]|nr:DUF2953 domain-containing protein [Bacillota bacterium]
MVELTLFIGMFCLFFFLPVQFRFYYQKVAWDDTLIMELTFLNGLLKRRRQISLLNPTPRGVKVREKISGNWLFYQRKQTIEKVSPYQGNSRGLREFLHRYRHYGLGITLLSYFLPARFHRWLLVAEKLEKKGEFRRLVWITKVGLGQSAATAVAFGLIWGLKAGLLQTLNRELRFAQKPEIKVIVDYQSLGLDTLFDCIFRVKLGYIIIASFLAYWRHRLMKGGVGID